MTISVRKIPSRSLKGGNCKIRNPRRTDYRQWSPIFASAEFAQFMQEYDIKHTITSPFHPQANGQAERMVQTVKHLLKKAKDPYIALLHYRNTQLDTGKSPAELFLGRKLKTTLPARTKTLKHAKHSKKHHKQMTERQNKQKDYFDRKASNKLSSFKPGDPVMMKFGDTWKKAEIVKPHSTPRSYIVKDEQNVQYRRNRILLRPTHVQSKPNDSARLRTLTDDMKEKGINGHVPKGKKKKEIVQMQKRRPWKKVAQKRKV